MMKMDERQAYAYESALGHLIHARQQAAKAKGESTTYIGDIDNPDLRCLFNAGWNWRETAEDAAHLEQYPSCLPASCTHPRKVS